MIAVSSVSRKSTKKTAPRNQHTSADGAHCYAQQLTWDGEDVDHLGGAIDFCGCLWTAGRKARADALRDAWGDGAPRSDKI